MSADLKTQFSVLDVSVSCIPNYYSPGKTTSVSLLKWLKTDKLKDFVLAIRREPDKKKRSALKAKLPAIAPSGLFTHVSEAGLVKHSGLIQFDIDEQDNRHIPNFNSLGPELMKIEHVAYCGLSVSGNGWWGLIPIAYPDDHKAHFDALRLDFKSFGVNIDDKCGNVKTIRGYSYDPEAGFNHNAVLYVKRYEKPVKPRSAPKVYNLTGGPGSNVISSLEACVGVAEVVHHLSGDNEEQELKTGALKMSCPCPDTRPGSRRFTVWPNKSTYYCHKCEMGKGNAGIFKLVQEAQEVSFPEAKDYLLKTFAPDLDTETVFQTDQKSPVPEGWTRNTDGELLDRAGLPVASWWSEDDILAATLLEQKAIEQEKLRCSTLKSGTHE